MQQQIVIQFILERQPTNAQQVAVTYYGNSHVNRAIANSVIAQRSNSNWLPYTNEHITYRYPNADLVLVNPEAGTGSHRFRNKAY